MRHEVFLAVTMSELKQQKQSQAIYRMVWLLKAVLEKRMRRITNNWKNNVKREHTRHAKLKAVAMRMASEMIENRHAPPCRCCKRSVLAAIGMDVWRGLRERVVETIMELPAAEPPEVQSKTEIYNELLILTL